MAGKGVLGNGVSLGEKQRSFLPMVAKLIEYAYAAGYELSLGAGYRDPKWGVGHPQSLHGRRLAIDLHLFKDGVYQRKTEVHEPLGEYWESLGGTWGGRWGDGNHYSLAHGRMR